MNASIDVETLGAVLGAVATAAGIAGGLIKWVRSQATEVLTTVENHRTADREEARIYRETADRDMGEIRTTLKELTATVAADSKDLQERMEAKNLRIVRLEEAQNGIRGSIQRIEQDQREGLARIEGKMDAQFKILSDSIREVRVVSPK